MSSEVVKLCQQMVQIPSVNPQDSGKISEPYGEGRLADFIFNWLSDNGLNPQKQQVEPGRENVLAVTKGLDESKTFALTSHMDTVDVKDMTIEPFGGELRDGRIYGRGAGDDKGVLSVMMIAFRDRVKQGSLPCNLAFLATCGEEFSMAGVKHFAENFPGKIVGAVFGEATGMKVEIGHKGVVRFSLETKGQSAHSSRPETGKNAIYTMAKAVTLVEEFAETIAKKSPHPKLGSERAALTVIQGGQQINVIPDTCHARVDWRILPGRTPQQCRDELSQYLSENLSDPVKVELINDFSPMETSAAEPLVTALLDAAEKTANVREINYCSGATDASGFAHLGIPTPVFGPGDAANIHTKDESIEIDQLEKGLKAYNLFLQGNWGV